MNTLVLVFLVVGVVVIGAAALYEYVVLRAAARNVRLAYILRVSLVVSGSALLQALVAEVSGG